MLNTNQSLAESSNNPSLKKLKIKKILLISLVTFFALIFSFALFYFLKPKEKQPIPSELANLSKYQASTNNQSNYDPPIKDFGKHGYKLSCEIFLKDIIYPNKVFGNFIVQAAAPCWFYDDNQIYDDSRLSSVDIPIVIEHLSSQYWGTIGSMDFVPVFSSVDKELAIKSYSQFAFVKENQVGKGNPDLDDSIVVTLSFASQTPYQDYYEGMYEMEGEYILKPEDNSERFLKELAEQHQKQEAIDYFVQHRQWDKNLDDYLFYYKAQRE